MTDTVTIIEGQSSETIIYVQKPSDIVTVIEQGPQGPQGEAGLGADNITWNDVQSKPATFPPSSHNHDGVYQPAGSYSLLTHDHSGVYEPANANLLETTDIGISVAAQSHTHSGVYQPVGSYSLTTHDHSGIYEPVISKASGYLKWTGSAWSFVNETYSLSTHDHSGVYQPAGSYSTTDHVHDYSSTALNVKTLTTDAHDLGNLTGTATITATNGAIQYGTVTGAVILTFAGAASSGTVTEFTLELTNPSTNVTWPTSVKWDGGAQPTLSTTGLDIFTFYTRDGGTTWRGFLAAKDSK